MNEIESTKEAIVERPQETPKEPPKETPKTPQFQRFYKICGLIQNISFGITFLLGLSYFVSAFNPCNDLINSLKYIFNSFALLVLLTNVLFILIGIILFYFNRKQEIKKVFGKKLILRGIIGLILVFIIYFIITLIVELFFIDCTGSSLPVLL